MVDIGLLHQLEELPRIGREALDIAALPLGIDGVEGERRLSRSAQAGKDNELVARNLEVDVLQIVLARAADRNDTMVDRRGGFAADFGAAGHADGPVGLCPLHKESRCEIEAALGKRQERSMNDADIA